MVSHNLRAQRRHQQRGAGEENIAGQDRSIVTPQMLGRGDPATGRRGIHDVVVVQGGQVRQLDRRCSRDDRVIERALGVAQLRADEGQERTHPLTARDRQMTRQLVRQVTRRGDGVKKTTLDDLEPRGNAGLEVGNMKIGCLSAHGISMTIFSSRLNTGPGNTPRAMVQVRTPRWPERTAPPTSRQQTPPRVQ